MVVVNGSTDEELRRKVSVHLDIEAKTYVASSNEGSGSRQDSSDLRQLSPHFRRDKIGLSKHSGTVDGDGIEELKLSNERALQARGIRYLRPNTIARKSFAKTENDPDDQEDYFTTRGFRLDSID